MQPLIPPRPTLTPAPRKSWRVLLWLLVCAAMATGIYMGWNALVTGQPAPNYITIKAKREDVNVSVAATGNVNPVNVVTVGSQISGPVTKVYVDFNDTVTKGQPLAEIDPSLLQAQIEQSESQLRNTKTALELAQRDALRNKKLFEAGFISRSDWERIQQNTNSAESSYQISKAQVDRDSKNLEYAHISSPVDGVVISRTVSEGQTVQASFQAPELFKIAEDLTNMQIDINLSEADISAVKEGMAATFTVDAFPGRTFPAKLTKLKLNPTNSNGTVTYQAVLSLENSDKLLIPGMTAYVSLLIEERKNVLAAPNAAFRYKPADAEQGVEIPSADGSVDAVPLYVLKGGVPQRIEVTTGINDNRKTEITGGGLQEGDDIILREERLDEEEG